MSAPNSVAVARVRLTQRLLIGAVESNPEYITDDNWQGAMEHVSRMLRKAGQEVVEDPQLLLFPGDEREERKRAHG